MDTAQALLKEPLQRKLLAKFNETGFAERLDVYLVNRSNKPKPERRVYEMTNNSRYLLDDPRITRQTFSWLVSYIFQSV